MLIGLRSHHPLWGRSLLGLADNLSRIPLKTHTSRKNTVWLRFGQACRMQPEWERDLIVLSAKILSTPQQEDTASAGAY